MNILLEWRLEYDEPPDACRKTTILVSKTADKGLGIALGQPVAFALSRAPRRSNTTRPIPVNEETKHNLDCLCRDYYYRCTSSLVARLPGEGPGLVVTASRDLMTYSYLEDHIRSSQCESQTG